MIKNKIDNKTVEYKFNNIDEFVHFIRTTERCGIFKHEHRSDSNDAKSFIFTSTTDFNEAEDLLLHGWDIMAKKLNKRFTEVSMNNGYRNKPVYSVQGYQACIPRYLQGVQDNMVSSKRVQQKQKVVTIVKDICYDCKVTTKRIEEESIKVLKLIKTLETQGCRCNLFISCAACSKGETVIFTIKIKDAPQRLNIKQVAFPMVHPSMLRRFMFAGIERVEENRSFSTNYGYAVEQNKLKQFYKGTIFIPNIVNEQEITDIEKYKIK